MSDGTKAAVKSADRVLDLFELLARRTDGMTHAEIAETLGIPKGSLSQLLKDVVGRDYVSSGPEDRRYRLGRKFVNLANRASVRHDLVTLGRETLERVTRRTQESSALNVLRGDRAEVVAAVSSPQRLVSQLRLGDLAPLYATSGGKVMLAHMPSDALDAYLSAVTFEATTARTIGSVAALRREVDEVRERGTAYSFEEYTPGIVGLAKAVLGTGGQLLGSINVAMPAMRYGPDADRAVVEALTIAKSDLERSLTA